MPQLTRTDKLFIDITHEDEWEVDFTVHTPVLTFNARHYDPAFPNSLMAGKDKVSLSGLDPTAFEGTVQGYELAFHLQVVSDMIKRIVAMGPRAFLNDNRQLVRR